MGSARGRLRIYALLVVVLVLLTLTATQASGAKPRGGVPCTWGASSERAQVVGGRVVTSPPSVTGCTSP